MLAVPISEVYYFSQLKPKLAHACAVVGVCCLRGMIVVIPGLPAMED